MSPRVGSHLGPHPTLPSVISRAWRECGLASDYFVIENSQWTKISSAILKEPPQWSFYEKFARLDCCRDVKIK